MSKSDQSGDKQNSAVGYGRPPVNRQFKPGQSGNPRGRPKGSKNFGTMIAKVLSSPLQVREKGKTRTLTKQEGMIEVMTNKALAGDPKAFLTIVQLADKYGVFKRQAEASYATTQSAVQNWIRRLDAIKRTQEETERIAERQNN